MSEKLITSIYEITKNYYDPISNIPLNENNSNLSIICKDGHANISLNINQQDQEKYSDLSKNLKNALSNINDLLSVNIIFTSEKNADPESKERYRFQISAKNIIAVATAPRLLRDDKAERKYYRSNNRLKASR